MKNENKTSKTVEINEILITITTEAFRTRTGIKYAAVNDYGEPATSGRAYKTAAEAIEAEEESLNMMFGAEAALGAIARKHLGIDTLKRQNSDHLDFHDCAVWSIQDALRAAFEAGKTFAK